ncbi:helix-turn-helix domain-containing protein [Bacillus altitudinis]|uniref:helix-turn-helix domain-containing protein n=1 Tax=Bacillus altitudinis TaxID=293387 RepID=UPI0021011BE2|nr:helix-turn-helix domain-containing protein [Bacillus altitudinis]UTV34890.1 helix-turn-helix domain-containing protein [Bacillus altitudinis]
MGNLFSVSHNKEINLGSGETVSNVYVRVYTSMFTTGLVAKMGANRFTTLMALASYMDEKGECYPTQLQLAEAIGVHKNTINKYINELLDFEIDGKPVVTRTKVNRGQGNISSYYKIHPLSQLAKFNGNIEAVNHKNEGEGITNGSDQVVTTNCDVIKSTNNNQLNNNTSDLKVTNSNNAIKYFQRVYKEKYGIDYVVSNYGREGKLMKDKLITPYGDMAKEIIDIAINHYEEMFMSNPRYPRPSIAMFSWAANQIVPMVEEARNASEQFQQANQAEEEAEQAMLSKLSKLN